MSEDLVKRLREFHAEIVRSDGGESPQMAMTREAADAIERLAEEAKTWSDRCHAEWDRGDKICTDLLNAQRALAAKDTKIEKLAERAEMAEQFELSHRKQIDVLIAEKDEWKVIGEEATSMHMQTAIDLQTEIIRLKGVCTELNDELHRKAK